MLTKIISYVPLLSLLVAVYAAGVATAVYVAGRKEKRRRITAKLDWVRECPEGRGKNVSGRSDCIAVLLTNPGFLDVQIYTPVLELPDGEDIILCPDSDFIGHMNPPETSFPHMLRPGFNCLLVIKMKPFAEKVQAKGFSGCVKVRARCCDTVGKIYRSKRLKFDLDYALKGIPERFSLFGQGPPPQHG